MKKYICLLIVLCAMAGCDNSATSGPPKAEALATLVAAQPSALRPDGELAEMFLLGSNNTDIQRENKLKEITGQVVQWQLPVFEVSRHGDGYKVQTSQSSEGLLGQALVGTFIYIAPRDDKERQTIEALKTGSIITIKAIISGSSFRSLELTPAILVTQGASQQTNATSQAAQISPPQPDYAFLIGKSPQSVSDIPALNIKFKTLLGNKFDDFMERIGVASGVVQEGDWLVGRGIMPHFGGSEESAFAINSKTGEIFAIMLTDGEKITWFGAADLNKLPQPLQDWYKNHVGNPPADAAPQNAGAPPAAASALSAGQPQTVSPNADKVDVKAAETKPDDNK
ncbi:MAG TPA: hypothetical protein VK832_06465 [Burkholderiaceae bacterium]|nr:hypothetical protein [Burkholderiaceae bacterium]